MSLRVDSALQVGRGHVTRIGKAGSSGAWTCCFWSSGTGTRGGGVKIVAIQRHGVLLSSLDLPGMSIG